MSEGEAESDNNKNRAGEGHQIGQTPRSAPTNKKMMNISNNKTNSR